MRLLPPLFTALLGIFLNAAHGETAPAFTLTASGLPGLANSSVAWGDMDNNGRLDLVLTGTDVDFNPRAQVWRNMGDGTFAVTNSGLPGVSQGGVATGDFDNDGNLDVLLSGVDAGGAVVCEVWRNQGGGTFGNLASDLPGVRSGALAWADFNNDGRLDILLTGFDADNNPIGQLYQNHTPLENTVKPLVSDAMRIDDSDFQFGFNGKTGQPYLIWGSTNLSDWSPIGSAREASPGKFLFRDSSAGSHAQRFYKTSSP